MRALIDVIERGLREEALGRAVVPPRLNLPTAGGFFRVMPAVMNDSGLMGYKVFHGSMKAGVRYLIAVYAQEGERLLALMGYFRGKKIGLSLREALELTDPSLKMWALVSLLRRYEPVPKDDLEAVASSHIVRITFWECLQELEMESLMPARWSAPQELAASALSRWLSRPNELNAIPEEIELMRTFPAVDHAGDPMEVYLFRFREYPKPWEPGEGWMAGVAGPYRDGEQIESPWSSFRRWDSMSPEDHFEMLWGGDACGRPGLHNQ